MKKDDIIMALQYGMTAFFVAAGALFMMLCASAIGGFAFAMTTIVCLVAYVTYVISIVIDYARKD